MNQQPSLSKGALRGLFSGQTVNNAVLQLIKLEPGPPGVNGQARYRLQVSDGINSSIAMLSPAQNLKVEDNTFRTFCIFVLKGSQVTTPQGKNYKVMIITDVEVKAWPNQQIGNPTLLNGPPQQQGQTSPQRLQQQGNQARPFQPQQNGGKPSPQRPPAQNQHQQQQQQLPQGPSQYQQQILRRQQDPQYAPPVQKPVQVPQPIPINALNPYISRWTIKARVTVKADSPREFARGSYFNCSFLDAEGTEIRAAFFAEACDKFFNAIEQGKVYMISNARIKFATKRGRGGCDFEMTVPHSAIITECADDGTIPFKHYAFVPIANIENCAQNSVIDVIGICTHVSQLDTASGKEKNLTKMTLTVCDTTDKSVRITLWEQKARDMVETLTGIEGHVVAMKDMKVFVSGGGQQQQQQHYQSHRPPTRSLTSFPSSTFDIDPVISDSQRLREWWEGRNGDISNIECISGPEFGSGGAGGGGAGGAPIRNNSFDTISLLNDDLVKEGPQYLTVRGTIVFIRTEMDPWYNACAKEGCNKKVMPENMQWRCNGCGDVNERCYQRYILSIMVRDHTGGCWLTGFDDVGKVLLGIDATALAEMKAADPGEEREFMKVITNAYFRRYNLRIRAQEQEWNSKKSVKFTLLKATPLDAQIESDLLIGRINKYLAQPMKEDPGPLSMDPSSMAMSYV